MLGFLLSAHRLRLAGSSHTATDQSLLTSSVVRAGEGAGHGRKGLQARAKLKRAAMVVLEQRGYHAMRINDVTKEAGVATGLFYRYFSDLKSLTLEVLTDFVAQSRKLEEIEKGIDRTDWFGRMHAHNTLVVNSYAERPGLMRCLLQLADEDAQFNALLRESFVESLQWLVARMPRLFPDATFTEHQALLMVYTLAGCGESLLRDYFINRDTALHASAVSKEQLIELLTVMFYRGLFAQNPPEDRLQHTHFTTRMVLGSSSHQFGN